MRRFLIRLSKFVSIIAIAIILIIGVTIIIVSNASFKLPANKNILVLGDSHTECAIDDHIFSRCINVAGSGTAYLYTYCKLRKFLNENANIDTVLLSFHWGSLISSADDKWMFNDEVISSKLSRYVTFMDKEELLLYKCNGTAFKAILQLPVNNLKAIYHFFKQYGKVNYKNLSIGGYYRLDRDKLHKSINNYDNSRSTDIGKYQKIYLLKIVDLCKSKNVKLILINTPTYNATHYGHLIWLQDYHNTYLHDTEYLDFSEFPLPDSCYGDIEHLNYKGAEIFSHYLDKELK
jgi:hypothetical protein